MGKIMLNSELYGVGVEANPTIPEGATVTPMNNVKIDNDYYSLAGGGGSSNIVKIYDSGSHSTGAPMNQTISYINNIDISTYDLLYIVYSSDRQGTPADQSLQASALISEILGDTSNLLALCGFADRWVTLRINATNFEVVSGNNTYQIFKMYAVKL